MSDTSSTVYTVAKERGLPHGPITGFKQEFHNFKRIYREEYDAARNLRGLGGGLEGGGFVR